MEAPATFRDEVAERFGVLPNFFCSAEAAPGLVERLWDFAKSAYLDNPLPSLFKERLFVHLSRFCVVRYCIVRHVGFLVGHGRPAGDGSVEPETVEKVIALLRRPVPACETLQAALGRLSARTVIESIPAPRTEFEPATAGCSPRMCSASTRCRASSWRTSRRRRRGSPFSLYSQQKDPSCRH